mgnify:CR=1 FL=1|jgi:Mg2+ and Co2+ transporter CorA
MSKKLDTLINKKQKEIEKIDLKIAELEEKKLQKQDELKPLFELKKKEEKIQKQQEELDEIINGLEKTKGNNQIEEREELGERHYG